MSRLLTLVQFIAAAVFGIARSSRITISGLLLPAFPVDSYWVLWATISIGPGRLSMTPDAKPKTRLVTAGPQRFVRYPTYTALLLFARGFVLTPPHLWKVGLWFCSIVRVDFQGTNGRTAVVGILR